MDEVQLAYGKSSTTFAFDEARFRILESSDAGEKPLSDFEIGAALDNPIASPPLTELISADDSVLIVVSDATRATASAQFVNIVVRRLIQAGVAPAEIAIIFATGIHRSVTPAEKNELLTPFIIQRIKTIDHNAKDSSQMMSLGTTKAGTSVEVNRAVRDYSRTIITGAINFHYFAGFTGGRKSICPGLASAATIEATHKFAFDFDSGGRRAGVGAGLLDGNAVHEECEEVAAMINPAFGINTVVDHLGRAVRVYAGHWQTAHTEGCREYLADHSVPIDEKRGLVIASSGGWPYDLNLIQAHKALDMAAHACVDGGDIILLAECSDGLGRDDFGKWFTETSSANLASRLRSAYEVNGQTAWSLLTKAERFRVHLVSSLPEAEVHEMRMQPARSLEEALGRVAPQTTGYLMPRGAAVLPRTGERSTS
jgi:lactate racemase